MKSRTLLYTLIGLLAVIAIICWNYLATPVNEVETVFDASLMHDCAPWDGTAFTISIPYDGSSIIDVSIWKSPDYKSPITYPFPDSSGRIGDAIYHSALGSVQQLSGQISLQPFEAGIPIEGGFDFTSASGEHFKGKFKAKWGNQSVACG